MTQYRFSLDRGAHWSPVLCGTLELSGLPLKKAPDDEDDFDPFECLFALGVSRVSKEAKALRLDVAEPGWADPQPKTVRYGHRIGKSWSHFQALIDDCDKRFWKVALGTDMACGGGGITPPLNSAGDVQTTGCAPSISRAIGNLEIRTSTDAGEFS